MARSYTHIRLFGRDLLSVPADASIRRAAWATVPGATWRARLMKSGLALGLAVGLDRMVGRAASSPVESVDEGTWSALLADWEQAAGQKLADAVVVHAGPARPRRVYVHLFDARGQRIAFAKGATAGADDTLTAERAALQKVQLTAPRTFLVPKVLGSGERAQMSWLLLEPLPMAARPVSPRWTPRIAELHAELAGPPRPLDSIEQFSWWPDFMERSSPVGPLAKALLDRGSINIRSVRAHGDFVNWNLHEHAGRIWLIDWESYGGDAPFLADPIRFFLGSRTRRVVRSPAGMLAELRKTFHAAGYDDPAIMRALAFLHGRRVDAASLLARAWSDELERGT